MDRHEEKTPHLPAPRLRQQGHNARRNRADTQRPPSIRAHRKIRCQCARRQIRREPDLSAVRHTSGRLYGFQFRTVRGPWRHYAPQSRGAPSRKPPRGLDGTRAQTSTATIPNWPGRDFQRSGHSIVSECGLLLPEGAPSPVTAAGRKVACSTRGAARSLRSSPVRPPGRSRRTGSSQQ
jgi:hypothetical protein